MLGPLTIENKVNIQKRLIRAWRQIMRQAESEVIKIKMSQNNAPKQQNGFRRNKHWWNKELNN